MRMLRDTSPAARRAQLLALRSIPGSTRLAMALEMSETARRISEAGIRHRHPDWTDSEVHRALVELLIGSDPA